MTLFHRRSVFAFVLGAMLAAAVLVGRSAFATTETISACFKPSNGTLYLLGESSGRHECQPGDIPISWNTAGVNGQDGVSVTSEALDPGDDPACPSGGSKFTSASGVTYACNGSNGVDGEDGQDGQDGDDGQDGQDFSGTFTSPNGLYKLIVNDTTARLEGPGGKVQIVGTGVDIDTPIADLRLLPSGPTLDSVTTLTVHAQSLLSASGAVTAIGGTPIILNGSGCGVLRSTDVNPVIPFGGGPTLLNPNGSPTVRTTC